MKFRQTLTTAFPISTKWVILSQKKIKLLRQDMPFTKPRWAWSLVVLYVMGNSTQGDLLHNAPWHWGQADGAVLPRSSWSFLQMGGHTDQPPVSWDLLDYTGLESAGKWIDELFHQVSQYPWVDPVCPQLLSQWCSRSLTSSFLIIGPSSCSLSLSSSSGKWISWEQPVLQKQTRH